MGIFDFVKNIFKKPTPTTRKISVYNQGYNSYGQTSFGLDSGGAKWAFGLSADGRSRVLDHYRMRQNARDAYHDSLDARSIVESFADNVVDTGLVLDAMPSYDVLGITPEQAEAWGADVSRRFHLWSKDKKQHRSGNMNFYQAQRLYALWQQRDNDMFARLYYSKSRKLQNPLQFSFIDPNQIRGVEFTTTDVQYNCDDGIKKNADGTEKEYLVWMQNPAKPGQYKYEKVPRIGSKSGKIMMIHGYNQEYAGQTRGYSRIGFALQELENLTDFSLATIKKAIAQSNMVMSVENIVQDPGDPLEGMKNSNNVSALGIPLTDPTTEEVKIADKAFLTPQVCPIPEAGVDTPGSMAFVANKQGDTIRLLENKTPAESYKDFVGAFVERLCAATGNPVEVVLKKFGSSFSASRATLVLAWRVYSYWREEMANDFLNVVYESWLSEEIAAGRVIATGFSDPRMRAAWLNCSWIGSKMPEIDPAKTAKANQMNIETGLTTVERESRNLNGSNAKDNAVKNTKIFEILPIAPWSKSSQQQQVAEEENGDEKEEYKKEEEE